MSSFPVLRLLGECSVRSLFCFKGYTAASSGVALCSSALLSPAFTRPMDPILLGAGQSAGGVSLNCLYCSMCAHICQHGIVNKYMCPHLSILHMDTHADLCYNIIKLGEECYNKMAQSDALDNMEKRSAYAGQTDARRKASAKYLRESVEDIRIRVPKGRKAVIQAAATSAGESLNGYVAKAVEERMEREGGSNA